MIFLCFFVGLFMTFGFFLMSSMVMVLSLSHGDWFNLTVCIATIFLLKVVLLHSLIVSPALDKKSLSMTIHARIFIMALGVWAIIIPYIEVSSFSDFVKIAMWEISVSILRLF